MSICLTSILKKIESNEITSDKKNDILIELANASTRCYPTWLEVAVKIYADINDQAEDVPNDYLKTIDENPERFYDENYQLTHEAISLMLQTIGILKAH